jgi:hypothetical protein
MAADAGAAHTVATAVLATLQEAKARTGPDTWLPELVRLLTPSQ